jgi:AbrB family looped-hinge helix DNA binding protein
MKTVTMSKDGRLTVPAEVRRQLGLHGETELVYGVDPSNDSIVLRPAVVLYREDAWAYTPEHRELLGRAHRDSTEGRVREISESELAELAD